MPSDLNSKKFLKFQRITVEDFNGKWFSVMLLEE